MTEDEYDEKVEDLQAEIDALKEEREGLQEQIAKRDSAFDDIEKIAREYS